MSGKQGATDIIGSRLSSIAKGCRGDLAGGSVEKTSYECSIECVKWSKLVTDLKNHALALEIGKTP
jgi:hypothetical protein